MSTIGAIEIQMLADLSRLKTDMDKANSIVGGAASQMTSAFNGVKTAFAALGVGLSVAGLVSFVKQGIDAADAMNVVRDKTGLATKEIAGIQLAFKQGNVSAEAMTVGLGRMAKQMVLGNDAFDQLGVKTRNADGTMRAVKDVLYDTADAFAGINDGAGKAALAQEIFGKTGTDMIQTLNEGSEGFREMAEMADKLGLTIDENTGKAADQFNDTVELLGMGITGVSTQIAAKMLPTLTSLAASFLESMTKGDALRKISEVLSTALKGLYTAGVLIVQTFNAVGKSLGAAGAMVMAVMNGDFKGALAIGKEYSKDMKTSWTSTASTIERAWDDSGNATVSALTAVVKKGKEVTIQSNAQAAASKAAAAEEAKRAKELQKQAAEELKAVEAIARARSDARQAEEKSIAAFEAAEDARRSKEINAARNAVKAAQEEYDQQGLLRSQIAEVTLKRLEDKQTAFIVGSENYESVQKEIDAQRELIDILKRGEVRAAGVEAAKASAAEWEKTVDQIKQGLTDSLYRAFESGKDFFSTFWKGIVNTFKTTVLRLAVDVIMNPINAAIGSVLGGATGSAAASGGSMGSIGSVGGMVGLGSFTAGTGVAGFFGDIIGGAIGAGTAGTGLGASIGSGLGGMGGAASAIPYVAAALAAYAIYKSIDKSGTPHSGASIFTDATGMSTNDAGAWGGFTSGSYNQDMNPKVAESLALLNTAVAGTINSLSASAGGAGGYKVGSQFASDNTDPSRGGLVIFDANGQTVAGIRNDRNLSSDAQTGYEEFLAAATKSTMDAINSLGLETWAMDMIRALGPAPNIAQLAQVAEQIAAKKAADAVPMVEAVTEQIDIAQETSDTLVRTFDAVNAMSDRLNDALQSLRNSVEAGLAAVVSATSDTTRILNSWDDGGAITTTPAP